MSEPIPLDATATAAVTAPADTAPGPAFRHCVDCGQDKAVMLFKRWGSGYLDVCDECYRARHRQRIAQETSKTKMPGASRETREAPAPEPRVAPVTPLIAPAPRTRIVTHMRLAPEGAPLDRTQIAQADEPAIIDPEVAEALKQKIRLVAGDAAREIAEEVVRAYLDLKLDGLVRQVVREIARETMHQAMRSLFGGLVADEQAAS